MNHPTPCEYTCRVEGDPGEELILVLNASESATPRCASIIRLCIETLDQLPADVRVRIYFLLTTVPVALKPACSFDSFFCEGNFTATPFWAVGLPEAPPPGRFIRVDVTTRAFLDDEAAAIPRSAYECWAVARMQDGEPGIEHEREIAYDLCRWLEGSLPIHALPAEVPEPVLTAVFRAAPTQAQELVYERLTHALPAVLAQIVWTDIQPQRADPERSTRNCARVLQRRCSRSGCGSA